MTGYQSKRAAAQDKLAQPAQEPVAWAVVGDGKFGEYKLGQVFVDYEATHIYWENRGYELVPVYTALAQRPWVDLTDEEITKTYWSRKLLKRFTPIGFAREIEQLLKEKNNG